MATKRKLLQLTVQSHLAHPDTECAQAYDTCQGRSGDMNDSFLEPTAPGVPSRAEARARQQAGREGLIKA